MAGLSDALFNRAMAIYQAFGPERGIPVEERWSRDLPEIPAKEHRALRRRCEKLEAAAIKLAEKVWSGNLDQDAGRAELARTFPILEPDRLAQTWSQAMYFASK